MVIAGDAGMGKSRLINEFRTSLAYTRWKIGSGACVEFASRPYGPILEAFAQLSGAPLQLGEAATKQEQLDAIVERLGAIAAKAALLIVVEDLHWADAASLDLLAYLAPKLHRMRILVVVSVRTDELHPDDPVAKAAARITRGAQAGRINLAPLHGAELTAFIDAALEGIQLPDETRRAIAISGDGNPFFTEELLKSAVEQNAAQTAKSTRRALPPTVRATLLDRLRPFDESERRVLSQAAMIGRTFNLALLAATLETEPDRLLGTLRRARDFQLIEEVTPATFRFRHGLVREVMYDAFLGAELQVRHRAIALALEDAPAENRSLEALAYHWWASGDAAQAARYNEAMGDTATGVHAHEDAIAFYERALDAETEPVARGAIVRKIANRRLALGWTKEAQATFTAAADLFRAAAEHDREAGCRVTAAISAYGIGLPEPTRPLEEMLTRLDAGEYLALSRVHLGLAWLAATFGFPTRATEHLAHVDPRALVENDIALRFHNVAAFAAMTVGDVEAFRREHGAWVAAAETGGLPQVVAGAYTNGAMCRAFFGLHEEAQADLDRALRLARAARSPHAEESVHAFAALCYLMRGDLEQARAALAHVSPTSENRVNITFATACGSVVGAALDDPELIQKWFDGFERTVWLSPEVDCGAGFAEIMVRRGRTKDAADLLHRALPDCELLRGNVLALLAVGRYGAAADRELARRHLERAADAPVETPERPALALFDAFVLQHNGSTEKAQRLAREAADGFHRLRLPLLEAQALEVAGDVDAAVLLFRRCGAAYDVRRLGGEHSGNLGASSPITQTENLLSGREREVAMLAARGRSNLEIARALSITHKTVEKHLGSAYQKLGISSRVQLAPLINAGAE